MKQFQACFSLIRIFSNMRMNMLMRLKQA